MTLIEPKYGVIDLGSTVSPVRCCSCSSDAGHRWGVMALSHSALCVVLAALLDANQVRNRLRDYQGDDVYNSSCLNQTKITWINWSPSFCLQCAVSNTAHATQDVLVWKFLHPVRLTGFGQKGLHCFKYNYHWRMFHLNISSWHPCVLARVGVYLEGSMWNRQFSFPLWTAPTLCLFWQVMEVHCLPTSKELLFCLSIKQCFCITVICSRSARMFHGLEMLGFQHLKKQSNQCQTWVSSPVSCEHPRGEFAFGCSILSFPAARR